MARGWLKSKAPRLYKFLTRRDRPWPVLREVILGAVVLLLLVTLLYGLTGQPVSGGYPVVVVTTGSMMHCEGVPPDFEGNRYGKDCDPTSYGRLGTIDPGDLVFVRKVDEVSDVATMAQGDAGDHYGRRGDIIVYRPNGNTDATPIIHRALFYVEVNADGTYNVPDLDLSHVSSLNQPAVEELVRYPGYGCSLDTAFATSYHAYGAAGGGFVTRGDNNPFADQCQGYMPARLDWVLGKARGELPWIGLIKLLVDDFSCGGSSGKECNFANAGGDSKVMLLVVVVVLVAAPWGIEYGLRRRARKRAARDETRPGKDNGPKGPDGPDQP